MLKRTWFLIFFSIFLSSTGSSEPASAIDQHTTIGKSLKGSRYSNLYFSGQPSQEDFSLLKSQGFVAVVNLRTKEEYDEAAERKQLEKAGLFYHNIPYQPGMKLSDTLIDDITKAVVAHRKAGKVLVHCGSGVRVGMWLGGHFYKDHNKSPAQSLEIASQLGLRGASATQAVKDYIKSHPR